MIVKPDGAGTTDLAEMEHLLQHLELLEQQFSAVRSGLTHSHRLTTIGTIASVMAHEYNNILTPIITYAQLSLANPEDIPLMRKAVTKALEGCERAATISSSLLGFARESDRQQVADLRRTIDDAVACQARSPEKDGLEFTVDVPDIAIAISPLKLQQVLVNLMLNARRVMREKGGSLRVTATTDARCVHIQIADTGPGIPAQIRERLFEPFVTFRPEESEEKGTRKGTGLGLYICRDLVESAGGTIRCESVEGEGATFHITLPRADISEAAAAAA